MNLDSIKSLVVDKTARQVLLTQKHSPKILFAVGVVGVVGTVVLACKATLQVSDKLDQFEEDKQRVAARNADSEERYDKQLRNLQVKTAIDIAKPYLLPLGLGIVSVGALTGSHVILTKRNTAGMAAYAAVDRAFKEYRQRVASELGVDTDRKFATDIENSVVEEKTADGKTISKAKSTIVGKSGSPYAACFDEKSKHYTRMPGMNRNFIDMQQSWANDKLRAKGHVFLNEVYDMLGLPRTKEGSVVGWVYDREDPNHTGDNYITFGVFDNPVEVVDDFLAGDYNQGIWLDFNVDGMIYDKI